MELDRAQVAIRERTLLDIMDLSLRIVREQSAAIACAALAGILPIAMLNHWLFLATIDAFGLNQFDQPPSDLIFSWISYLFLIQVVVLIEVPLATAPLTLYLGQATFSRKVDIQRLLREFLKSLPQLLLLQVAVRILLMPWGVTCLLPFVFWPYLSEVVLLERNALFRRNSPSRVSTFARLARLHSLGSSELFARAFSVSLLASMLVVSIWTWLWLVQALMSESFSPPPLVALTLLQVAVWMVAAYLTIVRFLSYLDLRIRAEGWELELQMRAEAVRLAPQIP